METKPTDENSVSSKKTKNKKTKIFYQTRIDELVNKFGFFSVKYILSMDKIEISLSTIS